MIECVEGNLGSGKSMFCVDEYILKELQHDDCFLTANEAFGLKLKRMSELHIERFGEDFNLFDRFRILNTEETMNFWRHPALNFDLNDKVEVPTLHGNGKELVTDFSLLHSSKGWKRCKIFIDESPEWFDADSWEKISRDMKYFLRHSRKLQIDVVFVCQDRTQLAKPLRLFFQQTTVCRNLGYESFSLFSLPKRIYWRTYFKTPDVSPRPMREGVKKIDAAWVGQMYDTSAGVAMTTGRKADTELKPKGIPIYWLILLLVAGGFGLLMVPRLLGRLVIMGARSKLVKAGVPAHPGDLASGKPADLAQTHTAGVLVSDAQPSARRERGTVDLAEGDTAREDVTLVGYARLFDGIWRVMLSDGRTVLSTDPEFETLTVSGLKYAGHYYHRSLAVGKKVEDKFRGAKLAEPASVVSVESHPPVGSVLTSSIPLQPQRHYQLRIHMQDGSVITKPLPEPAEPVPADMAQEQ